MPILKIATAVGLSLCLGAFAASAAEPTKTTIAAAAASHAGAIKWQPWSEALFEQARRENKFILVDLEAVWCHWCHVMEEKTYSDADVVRRVGEHYIAVKVDSDAHPELARRYEDYGWPATIVFNAQGGEIVKRRGYLRPEIMISMLDEIVRDPSPVVYRDNTPVTAYATSPLLAPALRAELEREHVDSHDLERGGLKQQQKFIDRDTIEYALYRAGQGDKPSAALARLDLNAARALIDPVWGGMYQYSTDGDWAHPHFEKIVQIQADALRLYAMASARFGDPADRRALDDIHRYVSAFLTSPEGAFYVSQDADLVKGRHSAEYFALDDAGRRRLGIPAIDKHVYARENGWMIQALAAAYQTTGDAATLTEATRAARWVQAHRALPGGGFAHGERDAGGPYLEDTLAMGRAFLALYQASADRAWLAAAQEAAAFIDLRFRGVDAPGFVTSVSPARAVLKPKTVVDENIAAARFANELARHTGSARYTAMAELAMRYLATEQVATRRRTEAGILLAALELGSAPTHLTIVGAKSDPAAAALYRAALAYPAVYRRIEWWDRSEGPLPNPDVRYPPLGSAAAFICTDGACSMPIVEPAQIAGFADQLTLR